MGRGEGHCDPPVDAAPGAKARGTDVASSSFRDNTEEKEAYRSNHLFRLFYIKYGMKAEISEEGALP
jgi:hypothetical protein